MVDLKIKQRVNWEAQDWQIELIRTRTNTLSSLLGKKGNPKPLNKGIALILRDRGLLTQAQAEVWFN